ncbi:hypothetical protein BOTBODRAFT_104521 [Botryobasidium botryosum FD-172 SS1]|uniref:Peptidase S28 n=1 Tax=Botryobasidium botryosum (strain FD-172 SS1) TaxID=930990 RepID=A0A067MQP2_BOTB1|nr:hypothetical protein BOTBODRAFT_104521 [Botryobasidium botryosum FD-172 SS1]
MLRWFASLTGLLALSSGVAAHTARRPNLNIPPVPASPLVAAPEGLPLKDGTTLPPYDKIYIFNQLIDHSNPSLGTFPQRYYFTYEYYEKGGPIVLSTPGEGPLDGYSGYITNRTINGVIAQGNKGAAVMIEHRFFGQSNPYPDLSEKSFRVHTLEQAIDDMVYFAKTVNLPMPGGDSVGADKNPWLIFGGSYSGALASWVMNARPGVFWAGYSSSGVVEAISYYWGYFEPIRQNMPKNCSADVQRVVNYMDLTFTVGTKAQKNALKAQFGMSNVTHLDDVAGALRNPIWTWQSLGPATGPGGSFFKFCDALEVKNGVSAPADGWGLDHALEAYGNYMKQYLASSCGDTDVETCVGTYDKTQEFWTDISLDNVWRSWVWFCCQYVGYWQDGAPLLWPSIVTRLVGPAYDNRQCSYFFPKTFPTDTSAKPKTLETNKKYGGWGTTQPRIFFANGQQDPWREATVSSDYIRRASTQKNPIAVSNGFHCSDLSIKNGQADATVKKVQDLAVQYFAQWIKDYQTRNPSAAVLPAPAPFAPQSIPDSVISAEPSAVPASITSASGPEPTVKSKEKPLYPNVWAHKPAEL